jgi:glucose/arabinose dehydrogenase
MRSWIAVLGLAVALDVTAAEAAPGIRLELVTTVASPLYVTHAGDERLFIVERAGLIKLLDPVNGVLPTPFLDLSAAVDQQDDGGLFTIAFHPAYASNGYFFVSYTEDGGGSPAVRSVVERYQVSAGDPNRADAGSAARLMTVDQPDAGHTNGQLEFGPDGYLYVGFGDGGGHGGVDCRAQHDDATLGVDAFHGSILRIDVDQNPATPPYYGIPPDNPFAGGGDGVQDEIWLKGLRNPWRFSFDPIRAELWIGDVGEADIEEIDRVALASGGGQNFGWPVMEGTLCHDPDPIDPTCPLGTPACFDASYEAPFYEYANLGWASDACSITGGFVYRGSEIPDLQGAYVFGDFCGGFVWALEESSPGVPTRTELARLSMGLTSFGIDAAGELYVTHNDDVYRLAYAGAPVPAVDPVALVGLAGLLLLGSINSLSRPSRSRARR